MSLINTYEKEIHKLNSEKTSILNLIKGVTQIISIYDSNKSKTKAVYDSSYAKYNEVKNRVSSLESELNDEKYTLFSIEKVLGINHNLHIQNEESIKKYISNLESYEKKLQTLEIDITIKEMQKAIVQLENKRKLFN